MKFPQSILKINAFSQLSSINNLDIFLSRVSETLFSSLYPRIKGWLFYMQCLSLSGLCWAKKIGIFIPGILKIKITTVHCISQGFGLVTFSLGKSIIRIPLKIWSNLEWQSGKFTINALDNKDFGIMETYLFFYLLNQIPGIFHNFGIYSKYCLRLPLPFKCALKEKFRKWELTNKYY